MKMFTLCLLLTAFITTGAKSLPSWPDELQGPSISGLKPEIYAIWRFNDARYGGDVCYASFPVQNVCWEMRNHNEAVQ